MSKRANKITTKQQKQTIEKNKDSNFRSTHKKDVNNHNKWMLKNWSEITKTKRNMELETDKTFIIKENNKIVNACAELSLMYKDGLYLELKIIDNKPVYWFNRLFVNEKIRNKGYGKQLVSQVKEWADKHNFGIVCQANAYGGLSQDQLVEFYKKYKFKPTNLPEVLIYNLE